MVCLQLVVFTANQNFDNSSLSKAVLAVLIQQPEQGHTCKITLSPIAWTSKRRWCVTTIAAPY